MNITKKYRVTFNVPEYNATYTFERSKSGAFSYGNGSVVNIYRDDKFDQSIDTRYDTSVINNFDEWCEDCLSNMFNPDYKPTWLEIK